MSSEHGQEPEEDEADSVAQWKGSKEDPEAGDPRSRLSSPACVTWRKTLVLPSGQRKQ